MAWESGSWDSGVWVESPWAAGAWGDGAWTDNAWPVDAWAVPSAGGENYSLTLDGSSYGISGTASQLIKATICGLATTSYEQSGTAAGLLRQLKVVAAGLTSYAISGTDASLSAAGDSSLVVDSGGYEISGTAAALLRTLLLSAATSSYTKSGTAATLLRALSLGALGSEYALSGTAADFVAPPGSDYILYAWPGTISYSGQIALLWYSAEIIGNVLMFLDIKTAEIILAVKVRS